MCGIPSLFFFKVTAQVKKKYSEGFFFFLQTAEHESYLTQTNMKIDTEMAGLKTMLESHKLDTFKYLAGRTFSPNRFFLDSDFLNQTNICFLLFFFRFRTHLSHCGFRFLSYLDVNRTDFHVEGLYIALIFLMSLFCTQNDGLC